MFFDTILMHNIKPELTFTFLQTEKAKVEQSLQKELERKLEEKDKDLQASLEKEKNKLEEVIANKEREYAQLQTEVNWIQIAVCLFHKDFNLDFLDVNFCKFYVTIPVFSKI